MNPELLRAAGDVAIGLSIAVYMLRWAWNAFSKGEIDERAMNHITEAYEDELCKARNPDEQ